MNSYTLSNKAVDDIGAIYDYTLLTFGESKADAYLNSLHETMNKLADSPNIGRSADDIRLDYLQFPIHKHMIFYKLDGEGIWIVRVLHQQMKYSMHLHE